LFADYDGPTMRSIVLIATAAVVLVLVAGCAGPAGSAGGTASVSAPSASTAAEASPADDTVAPVPTPVPGGQIVQPDPAGSHKPTTTKTAWGVILDTVPEDFPVYPGAKPAESPDEPVSAAYETNDGVDAVATWYRKALEDTGFSTLDLSDPLEDGSRVLDSQGDLPECHVQTTFRPAGELTMVTILYAAGCASLGG
jgi:hypothetical protein